jgi:hypothetical protein
MTIRARAHSFQESASRATFHRLICLAVFVAAACGAPVSLTAFQNAPVLVASTSPSAVALVMQLLETSPT